MKKSMFLCLCTLLVAWGVSPCRAQILQLGDTNPLENYAALELQRYYYQLSGHRLPIHRGSDATLHSDFILATLDNPLVKEWIKEEVPLGKEIPGEQGYMICSIEKENRHTVAIIGADSYGMLYGVYGLLEDHFGMRFYLNEDVFPEHKKTIAQLSPIKEVRTPKMQIRGFLPWTNFPQSATIYSWSDWRYIIDQTAKMRMNFILVHNYNGFCGHNEMFHNFEYNDYLSRGWMPTVKTGHGWCCPGWEINNYCFGASEIYDDYDFGADYALHNETLTNRQIKEKGEVVFQKVIEYAHQRGVKIGLGLDIDVILPEYRVQADNRAVITAQTKQIAQTYPDLDYLFCFQSEGNNKDSVFYNKWRRVFDGFYEDMKDFSPRTRIVVSGWGLTAESVHSLPEDVICAPISHYSARFESGSVYGEREYWGCPWLERDWNSSQYYYPYHMDLSETIAAYKDAAPNMNGFYALTWRLADAVSPKMWYISKAPWYDSELLDSSEKVYADYAKANYGETAAERITPIINQNEPFATEFAECQETPGFTSTSDSTMLFSVDKAGRQLAVIDECMSRSEHTAQKMRLSYLYRRIEAAKLHSMLNVKFKNYQWDSLPGRIDEWASSFLYRINDISSKGNIMSVQNRFIQQNYVKKIKELRKYQQVQAPAYIVAKRTLKGALVTWRNEEPSADYFVVSRNGEEIASVPCDVTTYNDEYNGKAVYTVCAVDTDKKRSPCGIPSYCLAGNADEEAPFIMNTSPATSIGRGENIDIKLSVVDNSLGSFLSATLYYRRMGSDGKWIALPFKYRIRSTFAVTIPSGQVPSEGIKYYVEVSDSRNIATYPVNASEQLHTIIVTDNELEKMPVPVIQTRHGERLQWNKVSGANVYKIYRSKTPKFAADACSFVTFVGSNTTAFRDNGFDRDGTPLRGSYYYRVTSVNRHGIESDASQTIKIDY